MINIRKFVGIATVGATLLGFSSMASAQKIVWHGPIYRPVHIVYNPVRYAPVPIPRFGIYEPVAPVLVTAYARRRRHFYIARCEYRRRCW